MPKPALLRYGRVRAGVGDRGARTCGGSSWKSLVVPRFLLRKRRKQLLMSAYLTLDDHCPQEDPFDPHLLTIIPQKHGRHILLVIQRHVHGDALQGESPHLQAQCSVDRHKVVEINHAAVLCQLVPYQRRLSLRIQPLVVPETGFEKLAMPFTSARRITMSSWRSVSHVSIMRSSSSRSHPRERD